MKILAFGEVLWDFIDGDKYFGGAPVNFAAHVVKCGGEAGIVTAVGRDSLGDQAILKIKELGISGDFVQQVEQRITGCVTVSLENGQPTYQITKDVAYDFINSSRIPLDMINLYEAFYFGTLIQRNEQSSYALYQILDTYKFSEIFLDVNLRRDCYSAQIISRSLKYCTILKMNESEATVISKLLYGEDLPLPEILGKIRNENSQIRLILITQGDKGCLIFFQDQCIHVPSSPTEVKDAVGAGDAFCAGFLTTYMSTGDALKAARIGNMIGAFVASERGAVPEYPEIFARKIDIASEA